MMKRISQIWYWSLLGRSSLLPLTCSSESWILIKLNHLLDDLVFRAVEMTIVIKLPSIVSTFFWGPLFFTWLQITFELTVIFANNSFGWIIESITDIIGSLRNILGSIDIVANERLTIWTKSFQLLCVESSILNSAVIPLLIFEL